MVSGVFVNCVVRSVYLTEIIHILVVTSRLHHGPCLLWHFVRDVVKVELAVRGAVFGLVTCCRSMVSLIFPTTRLIELTDLQADSSCSTRAASRGKGQTGDLPADRYGRYP